MKIALSQLNYHIGNFEQNTRIIIADIQKAKDIGADLVVFSELSVCGYPPHDLLEHKDFIERCNKAVDIIASNCYGIAAIIGSPSVNPNPCGKKLFNSALFLNEGKVQQKVHKSLLPTYDIFDEYRYFEPNSEFQVILLKGKRIALTICEDLWFDQPVIEAFGKNRLYNVSPMEQLMKQKPDFVVNIAGSPFSYTRIELKRSIFVDNAIKYKLPVFYVNQVGAQTELIFDGGSMVVSAEGGVTAQLKYFEEDFKVVELEDIQTKKTINQPVDEMFTVEKIHDALILGIRDYFSKMGFKTATLGLSGGIDSAVTLVLAAKALGSENMRVLLMPSKFSSDHSITDAVALAKNLNIKYDIINIQKITDSFENALSGVFGNLPGDVAEENIQARIRGALLMAITNKLGHILLNTSNKSEAAVGYGTLYGDMNGGLSVLGDVYKTQVYQLAEFINKTKEIIPVNTIIKPPSAELRPDQKDTDSLPEYSVLDNILFHYVELQESAEDMIEKGLDKELVSKVIKMVNNNEYKRFQTPPILRISSKAFGIGRRMPLVAIY